MTANDRKFHSCGVAGAAKLNGLSQEDFLLYAYIDFISSANTSTSLVQLATTTS